MLGKKATIISRKVATCMQSDPSWKDLPLEDVKVVERQNRETALNVTKC